jgi:hypothetical protein
MTQDKPTVESFIEKWLVGYESLEQKLEFGIEMKADLASLTPSNEKYWRERCEAAEGVIERFVVSPLHPDTSDNGKKIFAEWQELKSTPIPIQTPCGWTRVEDGLPEVDERVLICYDGEVCIAFHDGENWGDTDEYFLGEITHWMKLPTKPI